VHRLDEIPVGVLLAAGVPVALASDDPLLFGVGLAGQYAIGREALALTDAQLAAIATDGILASAAPPALKRRLRAGVEAWRQTPSS
jgi:adenosine deaminase